MWDEDNGLYNKSNQSKVSKLFTAYTEILPDTLVKHDLFQGKSEIVL
jgi:hypothetical protein